MMNGVTDNPGKSGTTSRERSPNYPALSLEEAVKRTKRLFSEIKRATVKPQLAVGAWGYKGLTGSNRPQLAALKHYGLLEYDKSGNVKVSRRGLEVAIRLPESDEYAAALKEAALTPSIFQDLYSEMRDASDEVLRQHLILNKGFSLDGAKRAIQAYRDTLAFANLNGIGYTDTIEEDIDMPSTTSTEGHATPRSARHAYTREQTQPAASAHEPNYRVPLSNGVTAEVTFVGSNQVTPLELQLLREFLEFAEKGMRLTQRNTDDLSASVNDAVAMDAAT